MKKNILQVISIAVLLFQVSYGFGQFPGCPDVTISNPQNLANSSNVIDLDCATSCVDLVADPFHAGATTEYIVESIPHTPPIPYNQSGGTPVSVNIDDRWSSVVDLPFNFCFYGQMYNKCRIGSNGAIKFGTSGGTTHAWSFSTNAPSPVLSDRGDIFGVYHDIDPSITSSGPSIKWYLLGTAPCRILCVVYKDLAHYNSSNCGGKRSTFMMVLYETTNAIDVYVERKDRCDNWNDGHAIIGIQNPANGNQGVVAPGRNSNPNWTVSSPEGWRFTPNGAPIYDVNWYVNDQLINTGNTINVCPSVSTVYEARAVYEKCDGTTVEASDFMTVNPAAEAPQVTASITDPTCSNSDGAVTISATGGLPSYTYSSDNVSYGSNSTFTNLNQGDHTFYVKDQAGCVSNILVNLQAPDPLQLNIDQTINLNCYQDNSGEVHLSALGGSGVFKYSMDGGAAQTSNIFTGLSAGTHQATVIDNNGGCEASDNFTLTEPSEINFVIDYTTASACNHADGEIYTTVTGGTGPYTYQLNGQPASPNATGDFSGILGGSTYQVTVTDSKGCSKTLPAIVGISDQTHSTVVSITPVSCYGANDGEIVLNTTGGTPPYSYEIDDTVIVNQPVISGLSGGDHVIMSSDVYGCIVYDTINVPQPEPLMVNVSQSDTLCVGKSITVTANATGGNGGYQYSWSTGQTTASFSDSPSQTTNYTVNVTDAKGCQTSGTMIATVLEQPNPVFDPTYSEGYPGMEVTFSNSSTHATSFNWIFGNGQTATTYNLSPQTQIYNEVGEHNVILTASNGYCQNSANGLVVVNPLPGPVVTFPNVFSPNGDGSNDELQFIDLKHVAQIEYWILNRWGNVMYHFLSEDKGYDEVQLDDMDNWNGQVENQNAAEGVYFYKYDVKDLNNQKHQGQGFFHLVR